jgi:hypothetical protein
MAGGEVPLPLYRAMISVIAAVVVGFGNNADGDKPPPLQNGNLLNAMQSSKCNLITGA